MRCSKCPLFTSYKAFEDECIRDDITFADVLKLKDILKSMTCENCRNKGKCAIYDNFNIKYCSDFERVEESEAAECSEDM